MKDFKFTLNATQVYPIWSGAKLATEKQPEEEYYRVGLDGTFSFVKADFDFIDAAAFNLELVFLIQLDEGAGYVDYWEGYFFKKNCKLDYDTSTAVVSKIEPNDIYRVFNESLEKEFNLIPLSPERHKLKYFKQGVLQVWTYPSNYMTNIVRGNYWVRRVDIRETNSVKLNEKYKFGFKNPTGGNIFVPGDATVLDPDNGGDYTYDTYERTSDSLYQIVGVGYGTTPASGGGDYDPLQSEDPEGFCNLCLYLNATTLHDYDDFDSVWLISGTNYRFLGIVYDDVAANYRAYFRSAFASTDLDTPPTGGGTITHVSGATNTANQTYVDWVYRYYLIATRIPYIHIQSGGGAVELDRYIHFVRWAFYESSLVTPYSYAYIAPTGETLSPFTSLDQETPLFKTTIGTTEQCRVVQNLFYQRLLSDRSYIGSETLEAIDPAEDVQGSELGYKFALPKEYDDYEVTDLHGATKTRYGKFNESAANWAGEYFQEFTSGNQTIPLNQPDWKEASVWMDVGAGKLADIQAGDTLRELRHAYKLSDVISILLTEIDPTITFAGTTVYSDFLYNTTNPVSAEAFPELFITPKSNVTQGEYSNEATKAIIKLSDIFEMLWITCKVKHHIDSSNRLRFEHISWYNNGGHYTTPQISLDLTTQRSYKSNELWSAGQHSITFNDLELAEEVRTKWMDAQSPAFDGLPIVGTSNYVAKGVIDEKIITKFSSDIDYMHLEADSINNDGFALLGAFQNAISLEWTIPFKVVTVLGNWKYDLQNGYLSFLYLHDKFYRHEANSEDLLINDQAVTASSLKRIKPQSVNMPSVGVFDPMELVTTEEGDGKVLKALQDIESDYLELEILHETI